MKSATTRSRRRAWTIVLWIAAALAVLAVAAHFAATAILPSSRLTPLVRDRLSRALDAPVALGKATIRILPRPSIALERLLIGDPHGYRRPAAWPRGGIAAARRASATLEIGPLLSRRLEIASLELDEVDLTAVRNETGTGNWEGLGGRRDTLRARNREFDLSLRRLDLRNARARFYDARSGAYYAVARADAALSLRTTGGGRDQEWNAKARLSGLGDRRPWPIGDRPITLSFRARSEGAGARWILTRAEMERGRLRLSGHGTVEGRERVLDFQLDTSSLPVADLLEILPRDRVRELEDLSGSGTIRLALRARGPIADGRTPEVRARAQLSGGRLTFPRRRLSLEALAFDLTANEQGADLASLTGRLGRSQFAISGASRDWGAPRVRARVRANVDLADVVGFLPLADSTRLAGLVRADMDGAGRVTSSGDAVDFGWSGRIALADVSASGLGTAVPVTRAHGEIGLSPARAWTTGLTAQLGRSDVTLDGTIERPLRFLDDALGRSARPDPSAIAHFALRSRVFDGDELFPARANEKPLPRVRAEGTVAIGRFKLRRLAGTNLLGRVRYVNGVTTFEDATCDAYQGHVRGNGWLDLSDRSNARYLVRATADGLDANEVLSAWTPARNLAFGKLQMTIDLDGKGLTPQAVAQSLSATGLAQILGGRLAGSRVLARIAEFTGVDRFRLLSFRDLAAPFRVTQGRVVFDPIAVATGGTDWLAKGSVGLDGTLDLRVGALVPPQEVRALPSSLTHGAGALLDASGRLALDMIVGGTVREPRISWDTDRTASRIVSGLERRAIDALTQRLGASLGDSLDLSRQDIESKAAAVVAEQQKKLVEQVEQQKEELANRAVEELRRLFERPAAPPPPPPADTAAAVPAPKDTARAPAVAPDSAAPAAPDSAARPDTARGG